MGQIKKLPLKDFYSFVEIVSNAYPGIGIVTKERKEESRRRMIKTEKEDPILNHYGYYRDRKLLGGLRLFDFTMTLFETKIMCGGGGLLAVDLMHKKEKVAKELMEFFIDFYLKKGAPMTALYPFRPDFYRKMGFGYGSKINEYFIRPADLPSGGDRANVRFMTLKDWPSLAACYNRIASKTHGMFQRAKYEKNWYNQPQFKIAAYKKDQNVEGYVIFSFKTSDKENFIDIRMRINEIYYENPQAFLALMTFLKTQSDQVKGIFYTTQDEFFHFVPFDPRNGTDHLLPMVGHETNTQGVCIMYRVINMSALFEALKDHDFSGQSCRLKLTIADSFLKSNNGSHIIHFENGQARLKKSGGFDVEISMDIAEFSSLVMGSINFKKLYNYGMASISDTKYLGTVNRIFKTEARPITTTQF